MHSGSRPPDQLTSDHGWNLVTERNRLKPIIQELKDQGIRVSLFMETDLKQIELARNVGTDRIELYTAPYAVAFKSGHEDSVLDQYAHAASAAQRMGIGVNAGHDFNFISSILIAFIILEPIAYVLMRRWLEEYAYRIDIKPETS